MSRSPDGSRRESSSSEPIRWKPASPRQTARDLDLAYEFLKVEWRTIQHYGVEFGGRRYNGEVLDGLRGKLSPYTGAKAKRRWPIHYDPEDITRAWFRHPDTGWGPLRWEHAPAADMPFSEDALKFARQLAAAKYTYPDDRLAVADLLERWNPGLGSSVVERRIALRLLSVGASFPRNADGFERRR